MSFGAGGKVTKSHKEWIGKWYKPWTWFSKKYVIEVIDDFQLINVSYVSNPVDPLCKIDPKKVKK
jgi:hypothetical protein